MTAALTATVVAGQVCTPNATAQVACWERVLDDWSASSLGGNYPVGCYRAAIAHMPEDVRTYSSAEDDIRRAMLAVIRVHASPRNANVPRRLLSAGGVHPLVTEQVSGGNGSSRLVLLPVLIPGFLTLSIAAAFAYNRRGRHTKHAVADEPRRERR